MRRRFIVIVLTILFTTQILISGGTNSVLSEDEAVSQIPVEQKSTAISDGANILKTNILENPSFELFDSLERPTGHIFYGSGYSDGNLTYETVVNSGSYSGNVRSSGSNIDDGWGQMYQVMSPRPIVTDNLILSAPYYVEEAGALDQGSYSSIGLALVNGTNHWVYIYYIVNYGSASFSNYTNSIYIQLNSTEKQWHTLVRNITADLMDYNPGFVDSTRGVNTLYFTTSVEFGVYEVTSLVVDDVSLVDKTAKEWVTDGGFETNPALSWYLNRYTPAWFSKATDATDGEYSLNITITGTEQSNGYASIYDSFADRYATHTTITDKMFQWIEFDWKYFGTYNGGDQNAYVRFTLTNYTHSYDIYYSLGADGMGSPWSSNTSTHYYFLADGFGSGDTWQHFKINTKDLVAIIGGGTFDLNYLRFYVTSGNRDNSTVTLLIDNWQLIAYTTGDPGFEMTAWDSPSNHLATWQLYWGTTDNVHRSTDAHSGTYSANLTLGEWDDVIIRRSQFWTAITPDMMFDASWKITELNIGATDAAALVKLRLEGGLSINYIIATGTGVTYTNTSTVGTIILNNVNTTGIWQTLHRNVTADATALFGSGLWNLTTVELVASTNSAESMTVLFDDVGLVDMFQPEIDSISLTPTQPVYYSSTTVTVEATDSLSRVQKVDLYYRTSGSWVQITNTAEDPPYQMDIPVLPFGTTVEYYIEVTDWSENVAIDDNGGSYYSFVVGDDIVPDVNLTAPADGVTITGTTGISADADDEGSGIAYVEFMIDGVSIENDTTAPYEIEWNSRTVVNGTHTLTAVAHDGAGVTHEASITINVQNDVAPPHLSDVIASPESPQYNEPVTLTVGAIDVTGVDNLTIYYRFNGGSWASAEMAQIGYLFSYTIPGQPYGTVVDYYIVAYDVFGTAEWMGNSTDPMSYTVTDYTPPTLGVSGPPSTSPVRDEVTFHITASDEGSGIDRVELRIDGTLVGTASDGVITWNTLDYENGNYTLQFVAYDNAGNAAEFTLEYQVRNPQGFEVIPDTMSQLLSQYGFILGAVTVVVIFAVIKIIMRRRQ